MVSSINTATGVKWALKQYWLCYFEDHQRPQEGLFANVMGTEAKLEGYEEWMGSQEMRTYFQEIWLLEEDVDWERAFFPF